MADKPKQMPIQIQSDPHSAEPKFSNMATIEHTDDTFLVDFLFVHARTRYAKLLSRVALSPAHAKRLVLALQDNVTKYEQRHGTIVLGKPPADPAEIN
ncbi:MAG: DUF3467 domain-containing protein [Bdellovibrionota bacterium]